jgi:hypothetical protein
MSDRSGKSSRFTRARILAALLAAAVVGVALHAVPPAVTDLYDPLQLRSLSIELEPLAGWEPSPEWVPPEGWEEWTEEEQTAHLTELARQAAWDVIRFDTTNKVVLPAWLSFEGEAAIRVGVRRKSSRALPSEADPHKVGLKVGISDFVKGQLLGGVSKLSLENGGDISPVAEGLAWVLHQMASGQGLYEPGHDPGLAAWVSVAVNGQPLGVYASVEQRNKQFMRNRGLWSSTATWHYEQDDPGRPVLEDGPQALEDGTVPNSPAYEALCYAPFLPASAECPTPTDAELAGELPYWIDMDAMLTEGAVDAYTANNDALISKGKNFNFVDRAGFRRLYYPWDLDSVLGKAGSLGSTNIYALSVTYNKRGMMTGSTQSDYQRVILNHPDFRAQYNATMLRLLDGPLSTANLHAFLDQLELVLGTALADDPYVAIVIGPSVADHFNELRSWIEKREASVRNQVAANLPAPRPPYSGGRDTTAPTVTDVRLAQGTVSPQAIVDVTATVSDDVGVASAEASAASAEWTFMTGSFGNTTASVTGTVVAPAEAGTYPVCVRATDLAGNTSASACTPLVVDVRMATSLAYTGPTSLRANTTGTLTANLSAGATPVAGRSVAFTFNKATYTAVTSDSGDAAVTVKAPAKTGTYSVAVRFAGDTEYVESSAFGSLSVTK